MRHYMVVAVDSQDDTLISAMLDAVVDIYCDRNLDDADALMHGVSALPTVDMARAALGECNWMLTHPVIHDA